MSMAEFPFHMLRDLKKGWDSYGAPPIEPRCIRKAYELWRCLPGDWSVVPYPDGGVQLEQHCDGFDIEVVVSGYPSPQEPEHG
jgi:hypothetical protein